MSLSKVPISTHDENRAVRGSRTCLSVVHVAAYGSECTLLLGASRAVVSPQFDALLVDEALTLGGPSTVDPPPPPLCFVAGRAHRFFGRHSDQRQPVPTASACDPHQKPRPRHHRGRQAAVDLHRVHMDTERHPPAGQCHLQWHQSMVGGPECVNIMSARFSLDLAGERSFAPVALSWCVPPLSLVHAAGLPLASPAVAVCWTP
jgi:hypothetical protein